MRSSANRFLRAAVDPVRLSPGRGYVAQTERAAGNRHRTGRPLEIVSHQDWHGLLPDARSQNVSDGRKLRLSPVANEVQARQNGAANGRRKQSAR